MDEQVKHDILAYAKINNLNMHYVNRYINFIQRYLDNPSLDKDMPTNKHHICPECWCNFLHHDSDKECNLITLTYKQHVVAHHILAKTGDENMLNAVQILLQLYSIDRNVSYDPKMDPNSPAFDALVRNAYMLYREKYCIPVINLNTGEVYGSAEDYGRIIGYKQAAVGVSAARRRKGTYYGCFWAAVSELEGTTREQLLQERTEALKQARKETQLKTSKKIRKVVLNLSTGERFVGTQAAAESCGSSESTVQNACVHSEPIGYNIFVYEKDLLSGKKTIEQVLQKARKKKRFNVQTYIDTFDNKEYESSYELAKYLGVRHDMVQNAARYGRRVRGHYVIRGKKKPLRKHRHIFKPIEDFDD